MRDLLRPVPPAARGAALSGLLLLAACGGPVELASPPATDRDDCAALAAKLPHRLADLPPAAFTPKDAYGGAWGDPPMTLTCGVGVPPGFGPASSCITANGVDWFASDKETNDNSADITLTTVTLKPRVALHVPAQYRGGTLSAALADLAAPLKGTLTVGTRCQ
ncbi:hypothetical protein GCM10009798_23930 [Nocardioides panacihumi]|uniref:DUF3515 domain-containing protein n=1 Tax=Nocardioides panacihumi TaxID=400774 RepID=A0ABN2R3W8_9ACTN